MEPILQLIALLLGLAFLVMPIFTILAYTKARRLEKRLERLEGQVEQARRASSTPPSPTRVVESMVPAPSAPRPIASEPAIPAADEEDWSSSSAEPVVSRPAPVRPAVPAKKTAQVTPRVQPQAIAEPKQKIQWEQWIGIRGAAVVGGLLFALAGLLFFKHALDSGWVTPLKRVISGAITGFVAIGASELLRRRKFRFAPAAAAGGGVVVLYATTWASYRLYGFIPALAALPLMGIVTAACAGLSIRLRSQFVAVLGLVGGFATPILLSMQVEHPIGLFGYILLLDLGLLALGLRTKWPSLGILAMLGTFLVELLWTLRHLDAHFFPLAMGSLGAFALVFAAAGQRSPGEQRRSWFASQVGALLLPFAFATYFATMTDFGPALWPLATLIAFLAVGAGWVGRSQDAKWLVTGAAAGALAVTATWLARTGVSDGRMWEFTLCTLGLGILFLVTERLFGRSEAREGETRWALPVSPAIVSGGFLIMSVLAAVFYLDPSPWPWLVCVLGHALLLHVQGGAERAGPLRIVGAILAAGCLSAHLIDVAHTSMLGVPSASVTLTWMIGAALFFLALALWSSRSDETREARYAWHAAAAFPLVMLALLPNSGALIDHSPMHALATMLCLAVLALVPAMVRGWGGWSLPVSLLFVARRAAWLYPVTHGGEHLDQAGHLILPEFVALLFLCLAPLVTRRKLGASRLAWAGVGLALLTSLPSFDRLLGAQLQVSGPWQSAIWLGVLALVLGAVARVWIERDSRGADSASRWLFGVGLVLSSLALTRGLGHEELLVGLALGGLALAALWRRLPSLGLKATSTVMLFASATGIAIYVLLGFLGEPHFKNAPQLVWNWTSYATGIPTLCAFVAAGLFAGSKSAKSSGTGALSRLRQNLAASNVLGLTAALLAFVWINLQVLTYFETREFLRLDVSSLPARDLALSISWILYALTLLAAGMARSVSGLRQVSLAFLLLTLMKVFLHDLGDLEGLYRVGSLFGLAISLLLVSLLYQRFVFPRSTEPGAELEE